MYPKILRISFVLLMLLYVAALPGPAGVVVFLDDTGNMVGVEHSAAFDPVSALNILVAGPPAQGLMRLQSAIPAGTKVERLTIEGRSAKVDFSRHIVSDRFDEAALERVYKQVFMTLRQFGVDDSIELLTCGEPLYTFLKPAPKVEPSGAPLENAMLSSGAALSGKSITLSPGHGIFWNGTGWYTQRPVYCSPLSEEDFHNLDMATYLKSYLEADGMLVKMVRCTDKSYGMYNGLFDWWKMASPYWLQHVGYPCTVYASYTGDCTLGTGASESSDDIRARPLASDYDNTNIYVSLHTNGMSGDCYGSTCPSGTDTYYDCSKEHRNWCTVSTQLSNAVHPALISTIRNEVADVDWIDRGQHDSAGAYGEIRIPDRAAILIELGFHDTCDHDAIHLRDPFWTSGAMWGIYKGICSYFGVNPTWGFYSDEYVTDDIPAQMAPGETRQAHITFRNRGVAWSEARAFRLGAVGDSDPFSTQTRYAISGVVPPGGEYTFTITLTAPTEPGYYLTDWQMVRDGYTWFGATVSKSINVGGAPDTEPPSAPTNLSGEPVAPVQVNLTWSPSTDNIGVAGYRIYRDNQEIGTTTSTTYSDTTCSSNTTYTYEVTAYDGAMNESARSNPAVVTTPPRSEYIIDNPQAVFTGSWSTGTSSIDKYGSDYRFIGTSTTETGTATWTPNIEVAGNYDVYCWYPQGTNRTTKAPYTVVWNGGSQTIEVNQQSNGGRWNLLVSAKPFAAGTSGYVRLGNATGESGLVVLADAVRFVKVATDTTPPVISNVASATGAGTATITWTTDEVATSQVEYGLTTSYGTLSPLDPTLTTSHSVSLSGLARRTTYHYRVRSKDAAGNESVSADYTFKTK